MAIIYKEAIPGKNEYFKLFEAVGWHEENRTVSNKLYQGVENSWYIICAYDEGRLVASCRVISDGAMYALIVEMMVHPDYQGRGIGKSVMKKVMEKCKEPDFWGVLLFAAENKYGFYEKLGFEKRPNNAPGMIWKKYFI